MVLLLKYISGYMSKIVTELFRRLRRPALLTLRPSDLDPPFIFKILFEERVSIIVVIITWTYHFNNIIYIHIIIFQKIYTSETCGFHLYVRLFSLLISFIFKFKNPSRRTNEQNCSYDYPN